MTSDVVPGAVLVPEQECGSREGYGGRRRSVVWEDQAAVQQARGWVLALLAQSAKTFGKMKKSLKRKIASEMKRARVCCVTAKGRIGGCVVCDNSLNVNELTLN